MRLLYGLLSATVINAYLAYCMHCSRENKKPVELVDFKKELGVQLLSYVDRPEEQLPRGMRAPECLNAGQ